MSDGLRSLKYGIGDQTTSNLTKQNLKNIGLFSAQMLPGSDIARETGLSSIEPTISEDIKNKRYMDALLKAISTAGDVGTGTGAIMMGTGAGAPLGAAVIGASQLAKLAAKMASKTKVPEIAKDLNTTEAITGYIIDPAKLSRNQLITKIENNKEIKTKTNNYLDEQGYGDTIPVYRIISVQDKTVGLPGRKKVIKKAEIGKENLISGSLTPEANLKTIKFFQDKGATQQQIVRYDVPRDKIKLTMGSIKDDITQNVNKKLKQKGFGQEKISGVETITNPSKSAKNLIDMQEEIIADVSGLKQTVLGSPRDLVPIDVNRILSGEIKTLKDFKNNLPSSFSYASQEDWNKLYNKKISLDEFRKIENAKTKEAFDKIIDFYGIKIKKNQGGMVMRDPYKREERFI